MRWLPGSARGRRPAPFVAAVAALAATASSIAASPEAPAGDLEAEARANFARLGESRSLLWDWFAIEEFAALPGADVVPAILAELRKTPPKGLEHRSHLLASALAVRAAKLSKEGGLGEAEARALLDFVRSDLRAPSGYWIAYNAALALAGREDGRRELHDVLLDASFPTAVRAAVALGLAEAGDRSLLDCVEPLLAGAAKLRSRGEQARLREAAAWAAARLCAPLLRRADGDRKKASGEEAEDEEDAASVAEAWGIVPRGARPPPAGEVRPSEPKSGAPRAGEDPKAIRALAAVAEILRDKALSPRTRAQVARALQRAWGTEVAYEAEEAWKQVAADRERKAAGAEGRTAVRFFGIPSAGGAAGGGERILFVLDGSDSMLTPLAPEEKEALWELLRKSAGAETAEAGKPEGSSKKGASRGKTGVRPARGSGLGGIDARAWEAVATRFDAARAHLKQTLVSMPPSAEFAVVLFGDEAEPLRATPAFVKATEANRLRAVEELDAIVPGPRDEAHPHGRLRGETNVYEAFAAGFGLGAGASGDPLAVDGCADAIYFLSDGVPTRDGFPGRTPVLENPGQWFEGTEGEEGEREVVINPETGATRKEKYKIPAQPRTYVGPTRSSALFPTGPYVYADGLVDELRRRNLFARSTVHVVGIGEAAGFLCAEIARAGDGRCLLVDRRGRLEER